MVNLTKAFCPIGNKKSSRQNLAGTDLILVKVMTLRAMGNSHIKLQRFCPILTEDVHPKHMLKLMGKKMFTILR